MISSGSADPVAETTHTVGTASAPTAASVIASKAAPPAGSYKCVITYVITGAQESAAANLRLSYNNASKADFPTAMVFNAGQSLAQFVFDRFDLDGTNVVKLTAVANAVASTVYTVGITLTRIA